MTAAGETEDRSAQINACLDVIADCLRADFSDGELKQVSLMWTVSHGTYEIQRDLGDGTEKALYYPREGTQ